MRIILISVGVHIIILPILAHYGAFKKIGIGGSKTVDIVMVAPPPREKPAEIKKQPKVAPKVATKTSGLKKSSEPKGTPLQQRVVAATAPAGPGAGGGGTTVVNPDKGVAPGTLVGPPAAKATPTPGNGGGGAPIPATTPKPETTPTPAPPPAPVVTPKPHVPVVTEVATTYNPSPTIPDDLRGASLDTTVTAQFMVSPEGSPTDVKIIKSSGNDELDSAALDTAKKWRFKPATRDGQPIESRVILHIEFEVQ